MIYVDMDPIKWAHKHGLSTMPTSTCRACGRVMPPGRPFLMRGHAGLEFRCPCKGLWSTCFNMTPIGPERVAFWKNVLGPPPPTPDKPKKRRLRAVT